MGRFLFNKQMHTVQKIRLLGIIGDALKIDIDDCEEKLPRTIFALLFLIYLTFSTEWHMSALSIIASAVFYGAIVMLTSAIKTQNKPGFRAHNEYFAPLLLHITILLFLIIPMAMPVIYDFANIGQFTEKTMEIVGIRIKKQGHLYQSTLWRTIRRQLREHDSCRQQLHHPEECHDPAQRHRRRDPDFLWGRQNRQEALHPQRIREHRKDL